MLIARTVRECREAVAGSGKRVGLVPTMGAFHEGHLSLMRRARTECDVVVVSLFVNPIQFGDAKDWETYPRDEARDLRMAEEVGVDVVFAPSVSEMYSDGWGVSVEVSGGVAQRLEGECRGVGHFRGVATVVMKLFGIVQPDVAYFGQKDAQQVAVVRRVVEGLNVPVRVVVGETVREADGLAMSSRNVRLSVEGRRRAASLYAALKEMDVGKLDVDRVDYFEIVDPETFERVEKVEGTRPRGLAVGAAWIGDVRLIDNVILEAGLGPTRAGS